MKTKIIELLANENFLKQDVESLALHLQLDTSKKFVALIKALNELESEEIIEKDENNYFHLIKQNDLIEGTLSINKKGFGFIRIENQEKDIFISKDHLKDAFDGDIVAVKIEENCDSSRPEGKIIRVIKRGKTYIVGTLKQGKRDCYVESTIIGLDQKIFIDQAHLHGAMPGHQVVVDIKVYKPKVKGTVKKILGHISDPGIDILSIVSDHGIDIEFPKTVFQQVNEIKDHVTNEQIKGRLDLRDELIVTIDGDDAKDLDDAISLEKLENGNYYLGVHIADVSYYVTENSALDHEAINRGTSIYLVDRVIPMLPHKLSNGVCSLNPNVDRLTISCFMEINQEGHVINHSIEESVIHSKERMTYNNVNKILDGDNELLQKYDHVKSLFHLMHELALKLRVQREQRGAIDFDVNEAKILVDKKGKPVDVVMRSRGASEKIIEEFMLLANQTIARNFNDLDIPFIYRIHEYPKENKLLQFAAIAKTLGYEIKGSLQAVHPKQLSDIVEMVKGKDEQGVISALLLRCMQKARYDIQCLGHFGLADPYYTHFTSPIRRYPDLLVHRLIREYLFKHQMNEKVITHFENLIPELADSSSQCERTAIAIEREVEDMKKAEYMEQFIGQTFEGTISSVTSFGFFVELDNTIEGLVHVTDLNDDYYIYDEKNLRYIGRSKKKIFAMSSRVKVRVTGANKKERNIDFMIADMKSNKPKPRTVIKVSSYSKDKSYKSGKKDLKKSRGNSKKYHRGK